MTESNPVLEFQASWPFDDTKLVSKASQGGTQTRSAQLFDFKASHLGITFSVKVVFFPPGKEGTDSVSNHSFMSLECSDAHSEVPIQATGFLAADDKLLRQIPFLKVPSGKHIFAGVFKEVTLETLRSKNVKIGILIRVPESMFDWEGVPWKRVEEGAPPSPTIDPCPGMFRDVVSTPKAQRNPHPALSDPEEGPSPSKRLRLTQSPAGYDRPASDVGKVLDFIIHTKDERMIWCHRTVLFKNNGVFAALLSSDMEESERREMRVEEFLEATMMELLHFIYTGNVSEKFPGLELYDLLLGAEKYELTGLKLSCHKELIRQLETENSAEMMVLGDRFKLDLLKSLAGSKIADSMWSVRMTEKGREMPERLWMDVFRENEKRLERAVKLPSPRLPPFLHSPSPSV